RASPEGRRAFADLSIEASYPSAHPSMGVFRDNAAQQEHPCSNSLPGSALSAFVRNSTGPG
ncbi:MAG: hypothetical protein M3Y43_06410, partial [Pseudomonadota bacterium]|nr:hypothetical protein [Pseudomonadota bacterium]